MDQFPRNALAGANTTSGGGLKLPRRVWDAPTRLFRWSIVALVFVNWLRAETGWMRVHLISGYAVLAALFRLIWGFLGSDTARFSAFLASPLAALRLLGHMTRREHDTQIGHNAAGGWMVLLLLAPLAVQAGTGLFAKTFDDSDVNSAFAALVSRADSDWPSELRFVAASFMFAAAFSRPARSDQISGFAFVLLRVSLPSGNRNQLAPMPLTVPCARS